MPAAAALRWRRAIWLPSKWCPALFSGTPQIGEPGTLVSFSDLSSGSPTAWSWTFGDGASSTAQNPTHTYASGGYYTVGLTVSKSGNNDTCTLTNYITIGASVSYVYPNYYEWGNAGQTLVSGGLNNLQAQDGSYMVGSADTTGAHSCYTARYTAQAGYSSSQILKIDVQYVGHCSTLTNYPGVLFWARRVAPGLRLSLQRRHRRWHLERDRSGLDLHHRSVFDAHRRRRRQ